MDNVTQRLFVPTAEGQEMRSHLSYRAKRELLLQIAPRYREASSALKEVILDEFVAATGYARKYAIRLLNDPADLKLTIERPECPPVTAAQRDPGDGDIDDPEGQHVGTHGFHKAHE